MAAGNITRDPELRYIPTGDAVCNFGIATNHSRKKVDGSYEDIPTFHNCQIWGKAGEWFAQNYKKGMSVAVLGPHREDLWEKEDGTKGSKNYIVVKELNGQSLRKGGEEYGTVQDTSATADRSQGRDDVHPSDEGGGSQVDEGEANNNDRPF